MKRFSKISELAIPYKELAFQNEETYHWAEKRFHYHSHISLGNLRNIYHIKLANYEI